MDGNMENMNLFTSVASYDSLYRHSTNTTVTSSAGTDTQVNLAHVIGTWMGTLAAESTHQLLSQSTWEHFPLMKLTFAFSISVVRNAGFREVGMGVKDTGKEGCVVEGEKQDRHLWACMVLGIKVE